MPPEPEPHRAVLAQPLGEEPEADAADEEPAPVEPRHDARELDRQPPALAEHGEDPQARAVLDAGIEAEHRDLKAHDRMRERRARRHPRGRGRLVRRGDGAARVGAPGAAGRQEQKRHRRIHDRDQP